jgi:hypothetical protein
MTPLRLSERNEALPTVALLLSPTAEQRAAFACQQLGVRVERCRAGAIDRALLAGSQALVFDGEPFESAEERLRTVRGLHPALPIILFVRVANGLTSLLLAASRIPGVTVIEQGSGEAQRLAGGLHRVLRTRHEVAVADELDRILPDLRERPRRFLHAVLRCRGSGQRCTVSSVATEIGESARRVLDTWPRTTLPRPKECLDWITLLYVARVHQATGVGWEAIAHAVGVDGSYLRRLRHRYFPDDGTTLSFDTVVAAFGAALRASAYRR